MLMIIEQPLQLPEQLSRPTYQEIGKFLKVPGIRRDHKRKLRLLGPDSQVQLPFPYYA